MKLAIIALPRTRSSMIYSMIKNGGPPSLFEPFHNVPQTRRIHHHRENPEFDFWNGTDPLIPWLEKQRDISGGRLAVKTLIPHHPCSLSLIKLAAWADRVIIPSRSFFEIACSYHLAQRRGIWLLPDEDHTPEKAHRHHIEEIAAWEAQTRPLISRFTKMEKTIIIPHHLPSDSIAAALRDHGINTAAPTTKPCRTSPPSSLISNPGQVTEWINQTWQHYEK